PLLAALLLVAFGSHALIPSGFMPGRGGLVICHGHMMSSAGMPGQGDTAPGHGGTDPQHPNANLCPFAAAATTMATAQSAMSPALASMVVTDGDLPPRSFIPRGTIVPTRLPRGPPAIL
ncbi:MAG: hypothetical protein JSS24_07165, partial [Proteobacteria bacterium]|nr:hypothetical protein [Pseudomonadota bacterium]